VDRGLGVIAYDRAHRSAAGLDLAIGDADTDLAIGGFDIRGGRARAEIGPSANVTVAEISFMWFVVQSHDDRIRDSSADIAPAAKCRAVPDIRQRGNSRILSDVTWPFQHTVGTDNSAAVEHDGPARSVQHHARRQLYILIDEHIVVIDAWIRTG